MWKAIQIRKAARGKKRRERALRQKTRQKYSNTIMTPKHAYCRPAGTLCAVCVEGRNACMHEEKQTASSVPFPIQSDPPTNPQIDSLTLAYKYSAKNVWEASYMT